MAKLSHTIHTYPCCLRAKARLRVPDPLATVTCYRKECPKCRTRFMVTAKLVGETAEGYDFQYHWSVSA